MSGGDDVFAAMRAGDRRKLWRVPLALAAVFAAQLVAVCIVALIGTSARIVGGTPGAVIAAAAFLLNLVVLTVSFFGLPQAVVLLRLRTHGGWTRFLTGVAAGWIYLFLFFVDTGLFTAASSSGVLRAFAILLADPARTVHLFFRHTSAFNLLLMSVLGALLSMFAWQPVYRLAGTGRDWDGPVLGGRPPYAD